MLKSGDENPGSITVYQPEMATEVAAMFNDFNELWPGGFGGRIPYTEQRVHDWLDHTSAIADLVALDAEGHPVGYCGVYPHYRDRHACYVTVLGVVPRVKGHKFGKRMLLRAVDLAIEHGLTRLDLNTWAGNMNAMPLYKKIGLFWVPETSVYMQNYIPELARNPLAADWFTRHPDWYTMFDRALTQAPDDTMVDGMALYTYRFTAGNDELVGKVDRYAWGLCGISSRLDGEKIGVTARVADHNLLMGIPNTFSLIVENQTKRDLELSLDVAPPKGLAWNDPLPLTLTAPRGETTCIARNFTVDSDAEIYDSRKASAAIRSRIILDGQVLNLVAGGRIRPALAISTRGGYHTIHPGAPTELHLDITNHANRPITGALSAFVEGLNSSAWTQPLELAGGEIGSATVPVPASDFDSAIAAHIATAITRDGETCAMPTTRFPLVSSVPKRPVLVQETNEHNLHFVNESLSLFADLKGGYVSIGRRDMPDNRRSATFEIGPPFGLSLDSNLTYAYAVEPDAADGSATLVLWADSLQFPGLRLTRHFRLRPGSREVEHWVTLTALSATAPAAGGRFTTYGTGGGISLNPFTESSESYTPIQDKIIACDARLAVMNDTVVPQDAAAWTETWTAQRCSVRGDLIAMIWKSGPHTKVRVSDGMLREIEIPPAELAPGERVELVHIWYEIGMSSLSDVRQRWAQLVSKQALRSANANLVFKRTESVTRPVEAKWEHPVPLKAGEQTHCTLVLNFAVPAQLPGNLYLDLPSGWEGTFTTPEGPITTLPMPQPTAAGDIKLPVTLKPAGVTGDILGNVAIIYRDEYEIRWNLPRLIANSDPITIAERELQGQPIYHIENGLLSFDVVRNRGGQLIHLRDTTGYNYIDDVFPNCQAKFFVAHFTGGAQPLVFSPDSRQPFLPPETITSAEMVVEGVWQGVRVSWIATEEERLRGQNFALTYLVTPGLPVVRMRVMRPRPTHRRFDWLGGFLVVLDTESAATQGPVRFTVPGASHIWDDAQPWRRFPALQGFVGPMSPDQSWAWIHIGDESGTARERSLGFLGLSSSMATPVAFSFGEFMGAFLMGMQEAQEDGEELEYALVLNRPQVEAEALITALSAQERG